MAKIGIALKMIYQGDQTPVVVNGSGWENYVDDNRSAILDFTFKPGSVEPMRMITFCPTGMLIVQSLNIDGRPSDLESIWLHIPDNADITGEEVRNLMLQANNLLLNKQRTMAQMQAIVAQEYPDLQIYRKSQASPAGGGVAFRYLSSVAELDDVLGPSRYQSYYKPYKYIALLQRGGIVTPKPDVADLSSEAVVCYVAVLPPSEQALAQYGLAGASLSIKQDAGRNVPLDSVRWVNKGATLTIVAQRPGFAPQSWKYKAEANGEITLPATPSTGWKKEIRLSDFRILSAKTSRPVSNATVTVNGRRLTSMLELDDKELAAATVEVSAPDFETNTRVINLEAPSPYTFALKGKTSDKALQVRLADGTLATLEYKSDNPYDQSSPLPGYLLQGNTLVPKAKSEWMDRILGAVAGALLVILVWVGYWWFFSRNTETEAPEPQPQPTAQVDPTAAAIHYLDSNPVWDADSLAKYPATQTLYAELKSYDFTKFLTQHAELNQSARYQELSEAMAANEKVIKTPREGDDYPVYDSKNDSTINIAAYIEFVSAPGRSHLNPRTLVVEERPTDPFDATPATAPTTPPMPKDNQSAGRSQRTPGAGDGGGQRPANPSNSDF